MSKFKISGKTKVYGLIGYPVEHSMSPAMHNSAFQHLGIDAVYVCFEVSPQDLKRAIEGMRGLGIGGLNVTVPHKEKVIKFLDEVTLVAQRIGAVNTIFRRGDKLIGTNTDVEGFIRDLRDTCRFSPKGKTCVVIGAGGASRAVCFGLADCRPKVVYINDIDKAKARRLMRDLRKNYPEVEFGLIDKEDLDRIGPEVDLLVNATPVGMKPSDPEVVDLSKINRKALVYDLVYNPPLTPLLRSAKRRRMRFANGLGMLLRQGAVAFKHWTGKNPPIEVMMRALKRG